MSNKITMISTLAIAAALAGCSSAQTAPRSATLACNQLPENGAKAAFYAPGNVFEAREVKRTEFIARAIVPKRTVGADLYVRAEPGMSAEYLERSLACHAASRTAAHPNDPLVPNAGTIAELDVRSVGAGYAVRVIGENPETGREIWQRAKSFAPPASRVEVEQVASAAEPDTF